MKVTSFLSHHNNVLFSQAQWRYFSNTLEPLYQECFHVNDACGCPHLAIQDAVDETGATFSLAPMDDYVITLPDGATASVAHTCSGHPVQ